MYKRHRFPPEIIQYVVWLYHRFSLSHRDVEDLLAERGITVSYESIRGTDKLTVAERQSENERIRLDVQASPISS